MYMLKEESVGSAGLGAGSVFYHDVIQGLCAVNKSLPSKYFYDAHGDMLFQHIMQSPEYYLTRCEEEIFSRQTADIIQALFTTDQAVDLVELGAGDASKTVHLLQYLDTNGYAVHYRPIDISAHILRQLEADLSRNIPNLSVTSFCGDYFDGLRALKSDNGKPKVVFFLGANIGNMSVTSALSFCQEMQRYLNPGDKVFMGFDLMKNPRIIQAAYDDEAGLTWQFNINLLSRMNRELQANFIEDLFEHYCQYDPVSGTCSSYLVSLSKHTVSFPGCVIQFEKDEFIHMEISQKYRLQDIDMMARTAGFSPAQQFFDTRSWFTDVVWEVR